MKLATGRDLHRSKCPLKLWDDCLERQAYIRSFTAHDIFGLKGETPETMVNGETPDISEFAQFKWYEWVKFRDQQVAFPDDKLALARYLGPSFDIGPAMTAKLLTKNGQYVHRSTYRGLTEDEILDPLEIKLREQFDIAISEKLGEGAKPADFSEEKLDCETPHSVLYEDDCGGGTTQTPDRDALEDDHYDQYLNSEVVLPIQGEFQTGKVKRRKTDSDGVEIGRADKHAICDTREYIVQFPDGAEAEFSANTIAENMYAQCDINGQQHVLLKSIIDHKKDGTAVPMSDKFIELNGRKTIRKSTRGWYLCVQWRDGTTTWETMASLKESNPVEVAEFAVSQGLDNEPAFAWWVPFTLKKRDRIISGVNARYHKRTHKFGVELPKSVREAEKLDIANGNTYWQDAIAKEIKAVRIAFKILNGDEAIPPGY